MLRASAMSTSHAIVLANLANAQSQQILAGNQVSSQKVAQDLKGYAGKAETLTAMQAAKAERKQAAKRSYLPPVWPLVIVLIPERAQPPATASRTAGIPEPNLRPRPTGRFHSTVVVLLIG